MNLGRPPEKCVDIYRVLRQAQEAAMSRLRPGVTCGELYQAAADCVEAAGYEKYWIVEHIGYGVGIRQSEFYPIIAKGSEVRIEENMVVDLLLPSIYVPHAGGPRLTDTVLVTAHGAEYLTNYGRNIFYC